MCDAKPQLFATVVTPRIVYTLFGNLRYRLLTIRLPFIHLKFNRLVFFLKKKL